MSDVDELKQKILNAIKNQRWYFFKNKPEVVFDSETALFWANLDYFPYVKKNNDPYSYLEVIKLLDGTNWAIPTSSELQSIYKKFPCKQLNGLNYYWFIKKNERKYGTWDLDYKELDDCNNGAVLPYDKNLIPANYNGSNSEVLKIFVENNLEPIFNDDKITELYRSIYIDKKLPAQTTSKVVVSVEKIDYESLLANYDVSAINNSIIQYYEAVKSLTDTLLVKLSEYEAAKQETIQKFSSINIKLSARYVPNAHLTTEENELLENRQKYLAQNLQLGMDDVKQQIISVKAQAEAIEKQIDTINHGDNSLIELAALAEVKRADFSLIAENLTHIVNKSLDRLEFAENHQEFIINLVKFWNVFDDSYRAFKTQKYEELATVNENIDKSNN